MQADIIIIGAGAAGLLAAKTLSEKEKKVIVLEARNRIGGRIHTILPEALPYPVESGAEFVHGNLSITTGLLEEAGLSTKKVEGTIWRSTQGRLHKQEDFIEDYQKLEKELSKIKTDLPVADFLKTYIHEPEYKALRASIKGYVEGYYAAELHRASTLAMKEELLNAEEEDQRVEGGYTPLMAYLFNMCRQHHCQFYFSTTVQTIHWQKGHVNVSAANGATYTASKILTTVPVGVLQAPVGTEGALLFNPSIEEKLKAVHQLGFGGVIKVIICFKEPFWKTQFGLNNLNFLFSEEAVPTWWTQQPDEKALLTGWCAGPYTHALKDVEDDAILQAAITSLARCFAMDPKEINAKIKYAAVFNWVKEPFTRGGYAYTTVNSKTAIATLTQPVEDTLYFAGEGLYDGLEIGTVEAAFATARNAINQILAT